MERFLRVPNTLHNVGVPTLPSLSSVDFRDFEAQCSVSARSSGRPELLKVVSGGRSGGVGGATLKVPSFCLPVTDVPHSASKLSSPALMIH